MMRIPFNKPFIAGKELSQIAEAVMVNCHISGDGPFTKKCENWLEQKLGFQKVLMTNSCTAAMEIVALLTDVSPGDEVIMPSFTFVSTANAFVLRGAVPVFVDIRPDTMNMDEGLIAEAITDKTKGIVPVHYAGVACEMEAINKIAYENGLWVAEDAAQAFYSFYKGQSLGAFGDFGCFSFHETKNIISGEGGALTINNGKYIERAEVIREKGTNRKNFLRGQVDKYTWIDLGSSYIPSDIIAAFLFAQLDQSQKIVERRCASINQYFQGLKPLGDNGFIKLPSHEYLTAGNGHLFYIICRSLNERSQLIEYLAQRGISAIFHFVPLHSSPAGLKYGKKSGELKVTDKISSRLLRLPLYYELTEDEVNYVIQEITAFFQDKSV